MKKQKNFRLPDDVIALIAALAARWSYSETDAIIQAVREKAKRDKVKAE